MGDVTEPAAVPLARLLAMSYRLLTDELHARLREQGWDDVRPSYGFVLLAVRRESTTTTDLAALLGTSKQATSKLLDAMEASGYVVRTADDDDGRVKVVQLAPRGHELLQAVERVYEELEHGWADVIGDAGLGQIRTRLTKVVLAAHGGALPRIRPVS